MQFRYKGENDWRDIPPDDWQYIAEFLQEYEGRSDVSASYDISCVLNGDYPHKTIEWLYDSYPEYDGLTMEQLKKKEEILYRNLLKEARQDFKKLQKSGIIETRKI